MTESNSLTAGVIGIRQKKLHETNNFFKKLYRQFDKALEHSIVSFEKSVNASLVRVEQRLRTCEDQMKYCMTAQKKDFETELSAAEILVDKELRSKVIMSQWTNLFLSESEQQALDAATFSICRFSLNIALSYQEISPQYVFDTGLIGHLIHYINCGHFLAVGPSLLALTHLSLNPTVRTAIVQEGALPVLLNVVVHMKSKAVLALCAKLTASLALDPSNKTHIVQKGLFHGSIDLILGSHCDIDDNIQFFALASVVNIIFQNDFCRLLAIELNCIKPIVTTLQTSSSDDVLIQALRALANIAFGNGFTANSILLGGGGEVIVELLQCCDINKQTVLVHSALSALSNMCHTEINQTHIGNVKGVLETVLRICQRSRSLFVITETANFIIGCCFNNDINKSRVAHRGGCEVLLRRLEKHANSTESDETLCVQRLCHALSSVLLYSSNHEKMNVIQGLESIVNLGKNVSDPLSLRALATVIVPMIPSPQELLLLHKDNSLHPVEKVSAVSVLKRIKLRGYSMVANPPEWLELSIELLSTPDHELGRTQGIPKQEYTDQLSYSKEFSADIIADSMLFDTTEFRGLIFSAY